MLTFTSDISEAFPDGELASRFREEWITNMVKDVRTNRDYSERTIQTARWARDQIKRQTGMSLFSLSRSQHHQSSASFIVNDQHVDPKSRFYDDDLLYG